MAPDPDHMKGVDFEALEATVDSDEELHLANSR